MRIGAQPGKEQVGIHAIACIIEQGIVKRAGAIQQVRQMPFFLDHAAR